MPKIVKSSRHSKITGDFAEATVLYWLSKYGFECAKVDHTGIDIIARNPKTKELMGISVKSRSRDSETAQDYISIPNDNLEKARDACAAFGCVPYFAFLIDQARDIWLFILSLEHLVEIYPKGKAVVSWKMTESHITQYLSDAHILSIEMSSKVRRWW